jgi:2-polyprenyl-3-methyl-5-hydroxy-6-metoxy-1,4-benzoquinol methylase
VRIGANTKYATANPLSQVLIRRFVDRVRGLVERTPFALAADVGCGEGVLLGRLSSVWAERPVVAVDIDLQELRLARANAPVVLPAVASAYALPFRPASFDLVLCSEVLEHLERPAAALDELWRIGRAAVVLSVPNEPIWRALNLARGAYVRALGNTPGHVNHWTPRAFVRAVERRFEIDAVVRSLPWTIVLGRRKNGR